MEQLPGLIISVGGLTAFALYSIEANSQVLIDKNTIVKKSDYEIVKYQFASFFKEYDRLELSSPRNLELGYDLTPNSDYLKLNNFYRNHSANRHEIDSFFYQIDKIADERGLESIIAHVPQNQQIPFEFSGYKLTHPELHPIISNITGVRMEKKLK